MVSSNGAEGATRPPVFLHIDDLLASSVDLDLRLPLRKILERGEQLLDEARFSDLKPDETRHYQYPRIDFAFRAFLHASIIAIKIVPFHLEYVALQTGRGDLKRRHTALMKSISERHSYFENVKAQIIENNNQNGTAPRQQRNNSAGRPHVTTAQTVGDGHKKKPDVRPKPQALLGKPVQPTPERSGSRSPADELIARVKMLGGPMISPGQDPRIKTQPHRLYNHVILDSEAGLPRRPDSAALLQPHTVSAEAAALPTSTALGGYTRPTSLASNTRSPVTNGSQGSPRLPQTSLPKPNSSASLAKPSAPTKSDTLNSARSGRDATPFASDSKRSTSISRNVIEATTVSVQNLYKLQLEHCDILLIDVRSRADFDHGHIPFQKIMCLDPIFLTGTDMTAEDICDRNAFAPQEEQDRFNERHLVDLVVFYDQDSTDLAPRSTAKTGNKALLTVDRALTGLYGNKNLIHGPKLLEGGADAWEKEMGPRGLGLVKSSNDVSKGKRNGSIESKLSSEDVSTSINNSENEVVRTPAQYLTRSNLQGGPQSMVSPSGLGHAAETSPRSKSQQRPLPKVPQPPAQSDIDVLQAHPTRPAPAASRPSTSGLKSHDGEASGDVSNARALKTGLGKRNITGLHNPGSWCYANSLLQALRFSPGFGSALSDRGWEQTYQIPRKSGERGDHPRLMTRILANLFYWMAEGTFSAMKAQTLMEYSFSITQKSGSLEKFGGNRQQDADEYATWLLTALDAETNTNRNSTKKEIDIQMTDKPRLQGAYEFWEHYSESHRSIVDEYWKLLESQIVTCDSCKELSHTWPNEDALRLNCDPSTTTLEQCLAKKYGLESLPGFICDKCKKTEDSSKEENKFVSKKEIWIARLPDLLRIVLLRFDGKQTAKNAQPITWDLDNLDMEPFFVPQSDRQEPLDQKLDGHYRGPFDYECYAVVIHEGKGINEGHYYAYIRDNSSPNVWHLFNDSVVTRVTKAADEIFRISARKSVPYMAFFRRKNQTSSSMT